MGLRTFFNEVSCFEYCCAPQPFSDLHVCPKKLESTHLEKYRALLSNKEKVKLILRQEEGLKEKKLFKWF